MSLNKARSICRPLPSFPLFRTVSAFFQRPVTLDHNVRHKAYTVPFQKDKHFSSSAHLRLHSTTMSQGNHKDLNVSYEGILEAQRDSDVLIIDVREQGEIDETGKLPGSIHIPMGDVSNVLMTLSEKDFKEKYEREKPTRETKIILSCRSGRRSAVVQEEIQKLGYNNSYNYTGGWLDWKMNQKA